ncbi:MAG: hydroxymethylglutaryl-CoA lyase [Gammaproteobacteria bacterium]|nr:hydroxymethylglutaryl-CoA lyase [Gammaproteobacteria bacterium]
MQLRSPTLMEVAPRDGLQNEPDQLPTDAKLALIEGALAAGVRRIEVTSFVHPGRVPQMADAERVCERLPERDDVRYTGLVLNRRGLDRAVATGRLHEVGMVAVASDTFGERNQGMRAQASVDAALEVFEGARAAGLDAQVTIACAFGCPFEGEVPRDRVIELARRLVAEAPADARPTEIALADTIGVGVPGQVLDLFPADPRGDRPRHSPARPFPRYPPDRHRQCLRRPCRPVSAVLDASIGGIGGCPFAPTRHRQHRHRGPALHARPAWTGHRSGPGRDPGHLRAPGHRPRPRAAARVAAGWGLPRPEARP